MTRRTVAVWLALVLCAGLIIAAMGWLTKTVLEAEKERSLADSRADLEERIRLALWRMDSAAAAVMIEENQSPPGAAADNPLVRTRFEMRPDGELRITAGREDGSLKELLASSEKFGDRFAMMSAAVRTGEGAWRANRVAEAGIKKAEGSRQSQMYQQELTWNERAMRGGAVTNALSKTNLAQTLPVAQMAGLFQPAWIDGEAFLLRDLRESGGGPVVAIEGAWLDAGAFREMLLAEAVDLLPRAGLVPAEPGGIDALTLASFPWRMLPGETPSASGKPGGPLMASLMAGWIAVAVALLAGAALVAGVMRMSERRASFVSAVTHELRTPLTTFRLYSEMLAGGMVADETKQAGYFKTLRREADRLSHLVENVLAYSRIERGSARAEVGERPLDELLGGMRERFEERLEAAGMTLRIDCPAGPRAVVDAAALEQILFNLVDNSAKYAGHGELGITVRPAGRWIEIEVRDHGPGIPAVERRRIFRAFHKSAQAAAESRPGIGLGLALSRRLARAMGGALECRANGHGASFVLRIPARYTPAHHDL